MENKKPDNTCYRVFLLNRECFYHNTEALGYYSCFASSGVAPMLMLTPLWSYACVKTAVILLKGTFQKNPFIPKCSL